MRREIGVASASQLIGQFGNSSSVDARYGVWRDLIDLRRR